jgi:hypothetical protein
MFVCCYFFSETVFIILKFLQLVVEINVASNLEFSAIYNWILDGLWVFSAATTVLFTQSNKPTLRADISRDSTLLC